MSRVIIIRVSDWVQKQEKFTTAEIDRFYPPESLWDFGGTFRNIVRKNKKERLPKEQAIIEQIETILKLIDPIECQTFEETVLKNIYIGFYRGGRIDCIFSGKTPRRIIIESFVSSGSLTERLMKQSQVEENLVIIPEVVKLLFMVMNLEEPGNLNFEVIKNEEKRYSEKDLSKKFQKMEVRYEEKKGKFIPIYVGGFPLSDYENLMGLYESKEMKYPEIDKKILAKKEQMESFFKDYPFEEEKGGISFNKKKSRPWVAYDSYPYKEATFGVTNYAQFKVYSSEAAERYVPVGLYTKEDIEYFKKALKLYNELFELLYKREILIKKECNFVGFQFKG